MKSIIKKQKDSILAELCQKIIAREWSQRMVDTTPTEVSDYVEDLEKPDEDLKVRNTQYKQDINNVDTNKLHIEADVFAYKALDKVEEEIKKLIV